jgi:tetratricopeptide (TPR) repeat protein
VANPRIDELRRKLEKDPGSRLFAQLAEELRKEGQLIDAMRVCREGLARHPNYPSARMTLGRCLIDSGDPAGARAEFVAVLAAAPDNLLAARLLGDCHEALADWPAAVTTLEAALALAPGDRQLATRLEAARAHAANAERPQAPLPVLEFVDEPNALSLDTWELAAPSPDPQAVRDTPTSAPEAHVSATAQAFAREGEMQFDFEEPEPAPVAEAPVPGVDAPFTVAQGGASFTAPDDRAAGAAGPARDAVTGAPRAPAVHEDRALPAAGVPSPDAADSLAQDVLASVTLAELYHQQGALDRAAATYRLVLNRDPGNTRALERLAAVEAQQAAVGPLEPRERLLRTIERLERFSVAAQAERS